MDTYITRESLQAILNKLDIDSAIDDDGLVGAGFLSGETVFIIDDTLVTARTNWYGIIPDHKQQEIEEFINSTNARVPVGKLIPVVMGDGTKTLEFRLHLHQSHPLSDTQLCQILDAYFQLAFHCFDAALMVTTGADLEQEQ